MTFTVIDNPEIEKFRKRSGFTNSQFKRLAGLFSRGASVKALYDIAVDVDFEVGTCTFTYYRSNAYRPWMQFVIRRVGPHTDMYELYQEGRGRIARSGLFDRTFEKLENEVTALMENHQS